MLKCLEKDRDNRFHTLGELAMALLELAPPRARVSIDRVCGVISAAGLPSSVLPVAIAPTGARVITGSGSTGSRERVITGESSAETVSTFGTTTSEGRSRKTLFVVVGVGIVGAAAAAVFLLRPSAHDGPAATPAPTVDVAHATPPKSEPSPAPVVAPAPVVDAAGACSVAEGRTVASPTPAARPPRPRPVKPEPPKQPSATPVAPAPVPSPSPPKNLLDNRK